MRPTPPPSPGEASPPPRALQVESVRGRVVVTWDPDLTLKVHPADEDLLLLTRELGSGRTRSHRVSHFTRKELTLAPGDYALTLARCARPTLELDTTAGKTPVVVWIEESPSSHVITWSDLDWGMIHDELQRLYQLSSAEEIELALKVLWAGRADAPAEDWFSVPARDHVTLRGPVASIELALRRSQDRRPLKTLFRARRARPEPLEELARATLAVEGERPGVELTRVVVETDTLQARVRWSLPAPLPASPLQLAVLRDGEPFRSDDRPLPPRGERILSDLPPGDYTARIATAEGHPVAEALPLHLPCPAPSMVLMPVDERRLFAYWSLDPELWSRLSDRHGALEGRIRCRIQVFHEWEGGLHHHPHLDREVHLGLARDYYLEAEPGRTYRARLVASIDGWITEELTPISNPAATGSEQAGGAPRTHAWNPEPIEHPTSRPLRSASPALSQPLGSMILHLHAHLPFIPDPVLFQAGDPWRPQGHPQEWYPEAVRETYLPLLEVFETLEAEGVDFKLSMDLSPPLLAMMTSPRHQADVLEYLERLIQLALLEVERTAREEPHYRAAAELHLRHLRRGRDLFLGYGCDLTRGFRRFQDSGHLELLTCVGTHPMMPLWTSQPQALRGQLAASMELHEELFGHPSRGIWLPECAYTPGVERLLEEVGVRYLFSEAHTVLRGDSPAEFGVQAPIYIRGSKVAVFPRDPETGEQVWSGELGYPGDPDYLDFHIRGGPFKYNRITSRTSGLAKEPYNPTWAAGKARDHAAHFVRSRVQRLEHLRHTMWKRPVLTAPYDAELFGHHWFEGPRFLYHVFQEIHHHQPRLELTTPSAYLQGHPTAQTLTPATSSWGERGSFDKWMRGDTSWMYRHVHQAAEALGRLASTAPKDELERRLLAQAGRELCLAMSSDLPFVISNGHFVDRMKALFLGALRGFWELAGLVEQRRQGREIELSRLRELELAHNLFPKLRAEAFASSPPPLGEA